LVVTEQVPVFSVAAPAINFIQLKSEIVAVKIVLFLITLQK
jgi:hypothetical protein